MKNILILFFAIIGALNAAEEKIYTQKDFDKQVKERISKEVDRLKKSSVSSLTKELLAKEEELEAKHAKLKSSQEQLKIAEDALNKQILAFEEKQKKVIGCMEENQENQSQRVATLVTMVSNMKPQKAAEVLSVQDTQISIQILEKIDPKRASKIFNQMEKEVSARLQKQYLNMRR